MPKDAGMATLLVGSVLVLTLISLWAASSPAAGRAEEVDRAEFFSPSFIVLFAEHVAHGSAMTILDSVDAEPIHHIDALHLYHVRLAPASLAELIPSPQVEWVVPQRTSTITALPDDPLLRRQWPLYKIGMMSAWHSYTRAHRQVDVAVIDTGVDASHPDLRGRIVPGPDFVNGDLDPSDDHGHGTHVSGVIAANAGNGKGIAGMAEGSVVINVKACGSDGVCPDHPVVAGIVYAIEEGADVVNLSLGGPGSGCPPYYELAAEFAAERGVLLVAASGNLGAEGNPRIYPAGCDGYVAVGATDSSDEWAAFSGHHDYVDLAAPGVSILSTLPPAVAMEDDPDAHGYGTAQGTSMAAPHVSALAGILLSRHPSWDSQRVLRRMEQTAKDLGKPGRDRFFGFGRIDAARAFGGTN